MPSPIVPSFKSKLSSFTRSKKRVGKDENTTSGNSIRQARVKSILPTSHAPASQRKPLAPIHVNHQPNVTPASKLKKRRVSTGKNVDPAAHDAVGDEHRKSSLPMKKTFSSMFTNAVRRTSSTRKEATPVRAEDGSFLPPMHLANRKGSRYAQPKEVTPLLENGEIKRMLVTETRCIAREPIAIILVQKHERQQGLRPLRLVNKVLSEGHPVVNLIPGSPEVEVEHRIVGDRETKERIVVVEMKVMKSSGASATDSRHTNRAQNNDSLDNANTTAKQNYPLKRRSIPYKPLDTSKQAAPQGNSNVVEGQSEQKTFERNQKCEDPVKKGRINQTLPELTDDFFANINEIPGEMKQPQGTLSSAH